jgi:hypothetical protein
MVFGGLQILELTLTPNIRAGNETVRPVDNLTSASLNRKTKQEVSSHLFQMLYGSQKSMSIDCTNSIKTHTKTVNNNVDDVVGSKG